MSEPLRIAEDLVVPTAELVFRATRAGGPGGQHVNTSSTRVELTWDVPSSPSLSDDQRARILEQLARRIDASGVLRLTDAGTRSQHRNRERVTARFVELVAGALHEPKRRRKTAPSRASKQARLEAKKRRSETKKLRGQIDPQE